MNSENINHPFLHLKVRSLLLRLLLISIVLGIGVGVIQATSGLKFNPQVLNLCPAPPKPKIGTRTPVLPNSRSGIGAAFGSGLVVTGGCSLEAEVRFCFSAVPPIIPPATATLVVKKVRLVVFRVISSCSASSFINIACKVGEPLPFLHRSFQ
jgi:hypothetical protein